jgi:hypothetical protein
MSNIAEIGGANVERKVGKASVRDAIIGTGVAIDKMLALTSQTPPWPCKLCCLHQKNALHVRLRTTDWTKSCGY